ncbi:MAG: tetratricopeptide repeat protein [Lacunisphaera sp.]|nr:tetratricopeptide repeat protein [Lacunisphaera sp.]
MRSNRLVLIGGLVLGLAALVAYRNSFEAPFVFDDHPSIHGNPTIQRLWPLSGPLSPPGNGAGVTGRPVVNLSLAVNYALGGFEVRGYHVMNLALHVLAGLTLWGVLRRTLLFGIVGLPLLSRQSQATADAGGPSGDSVRRQAPTLQANHELAAWTMALLWLLHPLLTESVVCVVQRTEVLGGLFYLLTLYCFIRAAEKAEGKGTRFWPVLTVLSCLVGVASKEIVASVPLMALLYDRTFVSGSFRAAWARRKGLYLALAATWLLLAWLMLNNQQRGRTVGFGLGLSSWEYLLTQCQALTIYLKLSVWPHPLVVDYGVPVVRSLGEVWGRGLLILALLAGTGVALWRRPVLGFIGAWFFVILAPSSSFIPLTTQTIAEHRMYLPLIAVVVLLVGAAVRWLGRPALFGCLALAAGAGVLTVQRNLVYRDDLTLWLDTVEKYPVNSRALAGVATAHFNRGNLTEARRYYEESLRLDPTSAPKQYNMGLALGALGDVDGAIRYYREAIRLVPQYGAAHGNLAAALVQRGDFMEAIPHLKAAIIAMPDLPTTHFTLGLALVGLGRTDGAMAAYEEAIRLEPGYVEARLNLGILLAQQGRLADAQMQLAEVVRLRPQAAEGHANLGLVQAESGRLAEAMASYEEALRLRPDYAMAHYNLGNALIQQQRWAEARKHFAEAVRIDPDLQAAREMLERLKDAP